MKALGMSFVYAIRGIFYCLHHERNMRIHFVCMAYMYFFLLGFDFFQLSRTQFAIIFLANAAVIMGELINTAVERTVDLHSKGKHPLAKAAKDTAAGAVLVAAIGAVVSPYCGSRPLSAHCINTMPLIPVPLRCSPLALCSASPTYSWGR
jgi:diacylglycerol kinase